MAEEHHEQKGILAIDLGIKTLATGVNEQGRFYHIGGFKGHRWYNKHLDRISVEARSLQKRVAKV